MGDRSAESGQYVTAAEAAANPGTTVHESGSRPVVSLDDRSVEAIAQRVAELLKGGQ